MTFEYLEKLVPAGRVIDTSTALERPTVKNLEDILGWTIPVLDHGHLRIIDFLGDTDAVCQAARVSYGKGTKTLSDDRALIRYLIRHGHSSPLEMINIKFHMKMPIFVARQFIRHRTAQTNEYSARYSLVKDEFYIPAPEDIAVQSKDNKQGRGDSLTPEQAEQVRDIITNISDSAFDDYHKLINDYNVARELARIGLTLNSYTEWYWKIDGSNFLKFLKLREDSHAQYEIRVYAQVMAEILRLWSPVIYEAWEDYYRDAFTLSGPSLRALRAFMLVNETDEFDPFLALDNELKEQGDSISKREITDLKKALGFKE